MNQQFNSGLRPILAGARSLGLVFVAASLLVTSLMAGCVSSRYKSFGRVQKGMEKDQVLESIGSPNVSRRVSGQDSWLYIYRDNPAGEGTKEVVFENGKVVYAGDRRVSKISAEEQDRLNEEANAAAAAAENEHQAERDQNMGIARVQASQKTGKKKLDRIDKKIRNDLYGTSDSIDEEKQKRAPVFEPVN